MTAMAAPGSRRARPAAARWRSSGRRRASHTRNASTTSTAEVTAATCAGRDAIALHDGGSIACGTSGSSASSVAASITFSSACSAAAVMRGTPLGAHQRHAQPQARLRHEHVVGGPAREVPVHQLAGPQSAERREQHAGAQRLERGHADAQHHRQHQPQRLGVASLVEDGAPVDPAQVAPAEPEHQPHHHRADGAARPAPAPASAVGPIAVLHRAHPGDSALTSARGPRSRGGPALRRARAPPGPPAAGGRRAPPARP